MLSPEDKKLRWVQENRGPKQPPELRVGEHLAKLTCLVEKKALQSGASEAAELLAGVVDEEFRRYCRVVSCKQGSLVIAVAQSTLRFAMRANWTARLSKALANSRSFRSIKNVEFQSGKFGVIVPSKIGT